MLLVSTLLTCETGVELLLVELCDKVDHRGHYMILEFSCHMKMSLLTGIHFSSRQHQQEKATTLEIKSRKWDSKLVDEEKRLV